MRAQRAAENGEPLKPGGGYTSDFLPTFERSGGQVRPLAALNGCFVPSQRLLTFS